MYEAVYKRKAGAIKQLTSKYLVLHTHHPINKNFALQISGCFASARMKSKLKISGSANEYILTV